MFSKITGEISGDICLIHILCSVILQSYDLLSMVLEISSTAVRTFVRERSVYLNTAADAIPRNTT